MSPTTPAPLRPRDSMAFPAAMVRAFSGRGAVSLRDRSVTGIQWLQFTPHEHQQFRFDLGFTDLASGCDIADDTDELWDLMARTGTAYHPLGLNWGDEPLQLPATSQRPVRALVPQSSEWAPNLLTRTGTFHKRLRTPGADTTRLVSFGVTSEVMCDPVHDLVRLRLTVTNRTDDQLALALTPRPRVVDPTRISYPLQDLAEHPDWRVAVVPAGRPLGWSVGRGLRVHVQADLPVADQRWQLQLAAGETRTVELLVWITSPDADPLAPDPGSWEQARQTYHATRTAMLDRLPRLEAADPALVAFYDTCAATVAEATWRRDDFILNPFFSAGTWLYALAWDISFSAKALALSDPEGLRRTLLALIDKGLGEHSYIGWDGSLGHHYSYSLIAGISALRDYIEVTGDTSVLDAAPPGSGEPVGELLAGDLRHAHRTGLRADGLVSYGANSHHYLETRTDGYQGATAVISIQLADAADWLASQGWSALDPAEVVALRAAGDRLWDDTAGWYTTAVEPGVNELYWSYQVLELLGSETLTADRKAALAAHLVPGRFLGPYGMYSVALTDTVHWDHDDADWGGGGQYTGMPLRIAEALWRAGLPDPAWQVLSRCLRWPEAFGYLPQEIMTDSLTTLDVEQAAEIAVGAGVQAVVFGIFGIRPQPDGSLEVAPPRPATAPPLVLRGYRHRGELLDVGLDADGWWLRWQGRRRTAGYGTSLRVTPASNHPMPPTGA